MGSSDQPAWIGAATAAAVRLAAEAGTEADDILEHGVHGRPALLSAQVSRLERSAHLTEVAADLAGLLWAECEDVPPIDTILGEPAAQAALEAVAESRRQAAGRLAHGAQTVQPSERAHFGMLETAEVDTLEMDRLTGQDDWVDAGSVSLSAGAERAAPSAAAAAADVVAIPELAPAAASAEPAAVAGPGPAARRPAAGAVLAGAAAAAIVLFGRRLRRA